VVPRVGRLAFQALRFDHIGLLSSVGFSLQIAQALLTAARPALIAKRSAKWAGIVYRVVAAGWRRVSGRKIKLDP